MLKLKLRTSLALAFPLLMIVLLSCGKEGENEQKVSANGTSRSHHTGQNCMSCHSSNGSGEGWFTVAGSAYDNAKINAYANTTVNLYTGINGTGTLKYTIWGDAAGNFYTTENIDFGSGLYVSVKGIAGPKYMTTAITTGQCNSCHGVTTDKIWTN
ncbi:MAG: hypothetical protein GZ094_03765 [Mariniphaga sp.]|nr:hypothetical protein [Mariniphaga sp.]